jgi:hypothetical protein
VRGLSGPVAPERTGSGQVRCGKRRARGVRSSAPGVQVLSHAHGGDRGHRQRETNQTYGDQVSTCLSDPASMNSPRPVDLGDHTERSGPSQAARSRAEACRWPQHLAVDPTCPAAHQANRLRSGATGPPGAVSPPAPRPRGGERRFVFCQAKDHANVTSRFDLPSLARGLVELPHLPLHGVRSSGALVRRRLCRLEPGSVSRCWEGVS